jgi:hypothetical protein
MIVSGTDAGRAAATTGTMTAEHILDGLGDR